MFILPEDQDTNYQFLGFCSLVNPVISAESTSVISCQGSLRLHDITDHVPKLKKYVKMIKCIPLKKTKVKYAERIHHPLVLHSGAPGAINPTEFTLRSQDV